jgi:hypothetical protein
MASPLSLLDVTAPVRSWAVPTLADGRVTAAYDVPPTAETKASVARTVA